MTPNDTKQKPVVGLAKNERCRAVEKRRSRKSLSRVYFIRHDLIWIPVCLVCVLMRFGSQPGHIHEDNPRVDRQTGLGISSYSGHNITANISRVVLAVTGVTVSRPTSAVVLTVTGVTVSRPTSAEWYWQLQGHSDTQSLAFWYPSSKLPELVTPLKGHSLSPRICPPTRSSPS